MGMHVSSKAIAIGTVTLALVAFAGLAGADGSGEWKSGQEVYQKVCGSCHERGLGPVIRGRGAPPEYLAIVRSGRRAMPAFRPSEISDQALVQLMDYVK